MSRAYINSVESSGWWPLQHHEEDYDPHFRIVPNAVRISKRDDSDRLEVEEDSLGDVSGGFLWGAPERGPAWSFAWPAVSIGSPRAPDVFVNPNKSIDKTFLKRPFDKVLARPVFDKNYTPDERFDEKEIQLPIGTGRLPGKIAGVVLAGLKETSQEELFLPTDKPLIAVNRGGEPDMASLVFDLNANNEIDFGRYARLHSAFHVVRLSLPSSGRTILINSPLGNGVAWQLAQAGKDGVDGGGLVIDESKNGIATPTEPQKEKETTPSSTSTQERKGTGTQERQTNNTGGPTTIERFRPKGYAIAYASDRYGGPLVVGNKNDQHKLRDSLDGEAINSLHLSTNALFYGGVGDAPLEFQSGRYIEPEQRPFQSRVHLRLDPERSHSWVKGQRSGLWRWLSESTIYTTPIIQIPPEDPPEGGNPGDDVIVVHPGDPRAGGIGGKPGNGPGPGEPQIPPQGKTVESLHIGQFFPFPIPLVLPAGTPPAQDGGSTGTVDTKKNFRRSEANPPKAQGTGTQEKVGTGAPVVNDPGPIQRIFNKRQALLPVDQAESPRQFATTTLEHAFSTLLFRSQRYDARTDLRNNLNPSAEAIKDLDQNGPVVARLEPFGFQRGPLDRVYTTAPGRGRYPGGTGPGGFALLPPEYGMESIIKQRGLPANYSRPVFALFAADLAFAVPDLKYGVISGWKVALDLASGDLEFSQVDGFGAPEVEKTLRINGNADVTGKLTVGGIIDPTGEYFTPQAARPTELTSLGNGLWVNTATPKKIFFYDGTTDVDLGATGGGGGGTVDNTINGYRLSLSSGDPTPTLDLTGASTLYLNRYKSNLMSLYAGANFVIRSGGDTSVGVPGSANKNYDVFAFWTGSTINIETQEWSTDTARNIALSRLGGVWVKSTELNKRYVGTVRVVAGPFFEDSRAKRFVWNQDNRIDRTVANTDTTVNWSESSTTYHVPNGGNSAWTIEMVHGFAEDVVDVQANILFQASTALSNADALSLTFGLDSTSSQAANAFAGATQNISNADLTTVTGSFRGNLGTIGYHALHALCRNENGNTLTAYGSFGVLAGYSKILGRGMF